VLRPGLVIITLRVGFWLSWLAASRWSSEVDKRVAIKHQLAYRMAMIVGAIVLAVPAHGYVGPLRLWSVTLNEAWLCTLLIAMGLAFSWWARLHLGALWSAQITLKKEHRLVDTGPYAVVRHPIYTGILLAVYSTAAAKGTVPGLVGGLLITVGVWMKANLEETWLRKELDKEAYTRYRRRTPMLLPFGPKGT
jgi:protein-S-isoprenylcysteine O-methyltransferase Ste14